MATKITLGFITGMLGALIFSINDMYTEKYSILLNIIITILLGWILGFIGELIFPTSDEFKNYEQINFEKWKDKNLNK